MECAADKGGVFDTVLLDRAAETGAVGGLSVYVGDSASDLAALTAADVGIVVGNNVLLRRVCAAAGLRLLPLSAGERGRNLLASPTMRHYTCSSICAATYSTSCHLSLSTG